MLIFKATGLQIRPNVVHSRVSPFVAPTRTINKSNFRKLW